MNRIKIYIVLLFLGLGLQQTYSQSYKFRTSGYSVLQKTEKGKWGKWSDLELVNIMVVLDTDKNRIVVNSQEVQVFQISDYIAREENDTDIVYSFICKDLGGNDAKLSIITRKMQDNRKQLYINYNDRIVVYNIFNM
ncbi:hypothetical protein [Flavobacterium hydatis]|jgi:hypothetical protein|uniref:Uncharacterized protein n=1 Tax=Flavobacterium hydatis TaxID=991 RepID=A0A086AFV0_FLAHY|nr:hypothetical protein [Flavobacterium hydatis]KFF15564.1 hypothetical protein IW20_13860 [Flavobacterium hydatis]OXA89852.1 hypothetical protein B0A62_20115 [Flavobacterium hydatis]